MTDIYEKIGCYSVIPDTVLLDGGLSGNKKVLYQIILKFSDNEQGYCYCCREKLAKYTGVSTRTLDRLIASLCADGYITKEYGLSWRGRREIRLCTRVKSGVIRGGAAAKNAPVQAASVNVDTGVYHTLTPVSTDSGQPCLLTVDTGGDRLSSTRHISKDIEYVCIKDKDKDKDKVQEGEFAFYAENALNSNASAENDVNYEKPVKDAPMTRYCENTGGFPAPNTDILVSSPPPSEKIDFHRWFAQAKETWNEAIPEQRYTGDSTQLVYSNLRDLLTVCGRFNDTGFVSATIQRYRQYRAAMIAAQKSIWKHKYSTFANFLLFGLEIFGSETVLDDVMIKTPADKKPVNRDPRRQTVEEFQKSIDEVQAFVDQAYGKSLKKGKEAA